jgi:DNA-directed RNA polymerase specialized sigma24 family protein
MTFVARSGLEVRDAAAEFERFFTQVEPNLRRALIARYGPERGREAAAEALAWAWEHWETAKATRSPVAYLYRVGQSRTRPRKDRPVFDIPCVGEPLLEPGLSAALGQLPVRQRVAALLVHGGEWSYAEVAELLGVKKSTAQKHAERGLAALRRSIGGELS